MIRRLRERSSKSNSKPVAAFRTVVLGRVRCPAVGVGPVLVPYLARIYDDRFPGPLAVLFRE